MKRFLTLVIALSILSGVFAQRSVDLDMKGTKTERISLVGPAETVPLILLLEATYQPEEEVVKVVMKCDESVEDAHISTRKKTANDQITHLLFLLDWDGFQYNDINFKSYFKQFYKSKAVMEKTLKVQINNHKSDYFRPAFVVDNGDISGKKDFVFALKEDELMLNINVLELDKPVVLTINNVIPLHAKKDGSLQSNTLFLKYISSSATITFNLPECARQYDLIRQYDNLNRKMNDDYGELLKYQANNLNDEKGIIQRQWQLLYKYDWAQDEIISTECDMLQQQFASFYYNYDQLLEVNPYTPDSMKKIIDEFGLLYESLVTASDGHPNACKKMKKKVADFIASVKLEDETVNSLSEEYDLMRQYYELIQAVKEVKCPVENKPVETPPPSSTPAAQNNQNSCASDIRAIINATNKISEDLIPKYHINGEKNRPIFNDIVKKTDRIINNLPESCREKNKNVIMEYQRSKDNYRAIVK